MLTNSLALIKNAWAGKGLALAASMTLFVAVWLNSFQLSLVLDATGGLSGFLAGDTDRIAALRAWEAAHIVYIARVALLVDFFVFIPAYAACFWIASEKLAEELRCDGSAADLVTLLYSPASGQSVGFWAALKALSSLPYWLQATTGLLVAADIVEDLLGWVLIGSPNSTLGIYLTYANAGKTTLTGLVLLVFLVLICVWLFNIGHPDRESQTVVCGDSVRQRVIDRAMLRRDIADVIWRSRYSVAFIAFFAAVGLVMNQGRDVLIGLTQTSERTWLVNLGAIAVTIGAVWMFAYSTYLWPRVMSRIRRPSSSAEKPSPPASQTFAKWWARLLGATPLLLLTMLSGLAAQDAFLASTRLAGGANAPRREVDLISDSNGLLLLLSGLVSTALGAAFFSARIYDGRKVARGTAGYFEVLDAPGARREVVNGDYRVLMVVKNATVTLIPLAFLSMVLLRLWGHFHTGVPLALAVVAVALTLWGTVAGHLSALALRQETPWMLIAVGMSGVLGIAGLTDNHRIPVFQSDGAQLSLVGMSVAALCLGLVLLAYGCVFIWLSSLDRTRRRLFHALWFCVAAVGVTAVLKLASHYDARPPSKDEATAAATPAPSRSLDEALVVWLTNLCEIEPSCATKGPSGGAATGDARVEAYVVSAEGGGIRAGYWTALTLAALTGKQRDGHFPERTFSISGVSGGSLGAATYRVCLSRTAKGPRSKELDFDELNRCVDRLGQADLLTPLISAWLFEDVLSRLIPTGRCNTPGCGFMSRGLWFERALEDQIDGEAPMLRTLSMRSALNGLEGKPDVAAQFAPHLFLNSTVVESGERAIASDVRIDPHAFPDARDQRRELGASLKLSTAAHNSARFPFVNAIGALRHMEGATGCLYQQPSTTASGARRGAPGDDRKDCLHLADGGYFDNSGTQTTQDIVRALRRILDAGKDPKLTEQQNAVVDWMRTRLRLTGIVLNYGDQTEEERAKCTAPAESQATARVTEKSTTAPVSSSVGVSSTTPGASAPVYDPMVPTCQGPLVLYSDLLGPAVTAKNVGGTGAGGRLAESRLVSVIGEFNAGTRSGVMPPPTGAASGPRAAVVAVELTQADVLYPLGWYLSRQASREMQLQALRAVDRAPVLGEDRSRP